MKSAMRDRTVIAPEINGASVQLIELALWSASLDGLRLSEPTL